MSSGIAAKMPSEPDLPPEFEPILKLIQAQPENVRELFHYAIVLMMIDDERAHVFGTYLEDSKTLCRVRTITGEEFVIVKPDLTEETEQTLLEQVRKIVVEDRNQED